MSYNGLRILGEKIISIAALQTSLTIMLAKAASANGQSYTEAAVTCIDGQAFLECGNQDFFFSSQFTYIEPG